MCELSGNCLLTSVVLQNRNNFTSNLLNMLLRAVAEVMACVHCSAGDGKNTL